ncbi:MAG: hypothetical protein KIT34_18170 [Cyanobacteria bacterium TGS_CYA1]|nr:hypothetical protein [Cyanobacteria bacterium TGS_CYA1]
MKNNKFAQTGASSRSINIKTATLSLLFGLFLVPIVVACPAQAIEPQSANSNYAQGLAEGPGIWVNMWNHPKDNLEQYCLKLHNHGVSNIFLQTSRSNTPALADTENVGKIIEACHKYKIHVLAWSFATLANPQADAQKLIDACSFRTPQGDGFDGLAANLEQDLSYGKVEAYSKQLRQTLGDKFPMVAVVYSPLNKAPQVARTPWKLLDKYYDVIAPMAYWNSKYTKLHAHNYTLDTVKKVRELCERPDVDVHVIGDGMKTHQADILDFMKACKDTSATSASLYPFHQMTEEQFLCLGKYSEYFPANNKHRLNSLKYLISQGHVQTKSEDGKSLDPAKPVSKGQFYKWITHEGLNQKHQSAITCHNVLKSLNLIDQAENLNEPISKREAHQITTKVIALKKQSQKKSLTNWFVPPAQASTFPNVNHQGGEAANYFDIGELILHASH